MQLFFDREKLAKIEYDEDKGYYLGAFYFDSLIGIEDNYLPFERSILTTENVLITWTLSAGWIVAPYKDGSPNYVAYTPLSQYLNAFYGASIEQERFISSKEELIDEFIMLLKERIQIVNDYLQQNRFVSPDELTLILKEHKQPQIKSFFELKLLLEDELVGWFRAKHKLLEYGIFDGTAFSPRNNAREELSN